MSSGRNDACDDNKQIKTRGNQIVFQEAFHITFEVGIAFDEKDGGR